MTFLLNWTFGYWYPKNNEIPENKTEMTQTPKEISHTRTINKIKDISFGDFETPGIINLNEEDFFFSQTAIIDFARLGTVENIVFQKNSLSIELKSNDSTQNKTESHLGHVRKWMGNDLNFLIFSRFYNQTPFNKMSNFITKDVFEKYDTIVKQDQNNITKKFIYFCNNNRELTKVCIIMKGIFNALVYPGKFEYKESRQVGHIGGYSITTVIDLRDMSAKVDMQWQLSESIVSSIKLPAKTSP